MKITCTHTYGSDFIKYIYYYVTLNKHFKKYLNLIKKRKGLLNIILLNNHVKLLDKYYIEIVILIIQIQKTVSSSSSRNSRGKL